ncbi:TPA: F18 fimbrial protein FedE [Escherichia coli]|nr:F18 fimbrial protein FedE [Escherichia coli]
MKSTKALLLMVMLPVIGVKADVTASASLTINAIFKVPTCDIQVPATYWLGILERGTVKVHEPLIIKWDCEGMEAVSSGLTASVVNSRVADEEDFTAVRMLVEGKENGSLLSFKEKETGKYIKIAKDDGARESDNKFCWKEKFTGGRRCELIPETYTHTTDKVGVASALIRFEMVYQ